ncbi:MAG: creatininase family protein [Gammaproteobacteria bacterium]
MFNLHLPRFRALVFLLSLFSAGAALALARAPVAMDEMTSGEIKALIERGSTSVVLATGGTERNGPFLVAGKHNLIVKTAAEDIARRLGNALVAPVLPFTINGDFDPPTGHAGHPGTFSLRKETFINVVVDLAFSLRIQGFQEIILLGDSGPDQEALKAAADALNSQWAGNGVVVRYVPDYYQAWKEQGAAGGVLATSGIREQQDEHHHGVVSASAMLAIDPHSVRLPAVINGVPIRPVHRFQMLGRYMLGNVVTRTVNAIREQRK